jgi:acyl-CoA hydrolase
VLPDWLRRGAGPGRFFVVPDGPAAAGDVLEELAAAGELADWPLFLGWVVGQPTWMSNIGHGKALSVLGGYASVDAIASGAIRYLPVRLSQVPRLLSERIAPEVVVVRARPERHGFRLSGSVGWSLTAVKRARRIVVEVDDSGPKIDTPELPSRDVLALPSKTAPYSPPRPMLDDVDRRIGELVVGLIPDRATIQHGPGNISEAVLSAIDRPVKVWSGIVSDALIQLSERGLLVGQAIAAYLWGGPELHELAAQGLVRLRGVEETHDAGALAAIDRFVTVNTALEVGLDGSVNIERVGNRMVAGIGGHADFCAAGSTSPGGLSIVALRASRKGHSTIVPIVERTSTARSSIDVVVTEHGVADLRGLDDAARSRALLLVCEPALRAGLERAVVAMK